MYLIADLNMGKSNKTGPSDTEDAEPSANSPRPLTASKESLEDFGEPLKFDPDFSGPIKKRTCTGMSLTSQIGFYLSLILYI